jgi:sn-glycerol 3-phosphate transport system ATP-binding protein
MTTVTLHHVSKRFMQSDEHGGQIVTALNNLSLKIASGDILAILGPSGSGKSTLLRLVAGLITPDSGDILFDNVNLREIPISERGIGMVFQDGALIPHWEARRNIGFHLSLRHREHEVPARVARIAQITGIGLEYLLDRRPGQLSGGERQRVGIARALARDPRVFLFDEPFSNIDAKLRAQGRVELKRLLQEFPVTSIYVTHDQIEAVALAHRIAVMRDGHFEQVDTYQDLYNNPINLFVATFIGTPTVNLFPGCVRGHQWHGETFGGFHVRHDLDDGAAVTMGVRPERIRPHDDGIPVRILAVTPYFAERFALLEVRSDAGETFQMTVPLEQHPQQDEVLRALPDNESLWFFDPESGRRIG